MSSKAFSWKHNSDGDDDDAMVRKTIPEAQSRVMNGDVSVRSVLTRMTRSQLKELVLRAPTLEHTRTQIRQTHESKDFGKQEKNRLCGEFHTTCELSFLET